jgi:alpha-tubulin suppressor-like RCC1 family protein
VGTDTDWDTVTAAWRSTCGLKIDHTAWCWGDNRFGQLGNPDNTGGDGTTQIPNPTPTQVTGHSTWSTIAPTDHHTCGVKTDHTTWCWGANSYGQLGNDSDADWANTTPHPIPGLVGSSTDWVDVVTGVYHTCAVKTDATTWCWGYNGLGALGSATHYATEVPVTWPVQADLAP